MLFGGGSSQAAPVAEPQNQSFEERKMGGSCEIQAKGTFTGGSMDWGDKGLIWFCTRRLHKLPQRDSVRHECLLVLP
jgi:hypothetical protein